MSHSKTESKLNSIWTAVHQLWCHRQRFHCIFMQTKVSENSLQSQRKISHAMWMTRLNNNAHFKNAMLTSNSASHSGLFHGLPHGSITRLLLRFNPASRNYPTVWAPVTGHQQDLMTDTQQQYKIFYKPWLTCNHFNYYPAPYWFSTCLNGGHSCPSFCLNSKIWVNSKFT